MSKNWTTVIEPKVPLFKVPIKEIIKYRELVWTLVKRNYEVQYKQTILGPLWLIFSLIINSGIFSFVFGYVGQFSSDGTPYFLFYMTGSVVWDFFISCFGSNTGVLLENSYLFGKVYFPRLIMPIANILFNAIRVGIKFLVTLCAWLFFYLAGDAQMIDLKILWVLPIALVMSLMGTAMGLIVSCITIKYRDFSHMVGLLTTVMMYVSPVVYSTSQLPKYVQGLVYINPISSYVEAFRLCMLGSGEINMLALIYSTIFTLALTIVAVVMFNQTEKDFIDII
ncbi:ABC transporter permease [Pseudobutyrivibrio xylanivorans]|uniref:Transport permease protein n=1 Tax=Pseudobutyrivibrio xylanivorans DSM 14809 TaxID=1123012 RepID=A0A1M6IK08_PSEXY|nr:ABC transporter permease [Pseudobutyrivibrio xylanivorans]SHJ34749.1 lipopolysaccharide transport system permease protein [Pseudobutyrivibrio xylanivorans DSM 14809]